MKSVVAVLCLMPLVYGTVQNVDLPQHAKDIFKTPGSQYALYAKYTEIEAFTPNQGAETLTYKGLNLNRDTEVDQKDLDLVFWHPRLKVFSKKVIKAIDTSGDGKLNEGEIKTFISQKQVKITVVECKYLKSPSAQEACLADQVAKHAAHVITKDVAVQLAQNLNGNEQSIPIGMFEDDPTAVEELGAENGQIAFDKFYDYLQQESILYEFRKCWTKLDQKEGIITYELGCVVSSLKQYIKDDLTEMDISVVFRAIDKDNDEKISQEELKGFTSDKTDLNKVMELLDMSVTNDKLVDYAEFRNYVRSPTVAYQAEKECTAPFHKQEDEIHCLYNLIRGLLMDTHTPIWLVMPDVEQNIAFELFDSDESGKITFDELRNVEKAGADPMHEYAIYRFIDEMDTFDDDRDIDLEEFDGYLDIPHMVYGITDCLLKIRGVLTRGICLMTEIIDIIDNYKFVDKDAWKSWLNSYTTPDHPNHIVKNVEKGATDLFITELGQGGMEVTLIEFEWYAKQQELSDRYEKTSIVTSHSGRIFSTHQLKSLNGTLQIWIEDDLTEADIVGIFKKFDLNQDHEISGQEIESKAEGFKTLMKLIDSIEIYGPDATSVTYREFWLWMSSHGIGVQTDLYLSPKYVLEEKCIKTEKTNEAEINCCFKKIEEALEVQYKKEEY